MRTAPLLAVLVFLPLAAQAACPPAPDYADERAALHTRLLNAPTEELANAVADAIWRVWTRAPDSFAQALLDRGMARREAWDFADAESIFDELIAYCPGYNEGYNQRAFVRFLRENYEGSLRDIDTVLAADPLHFGALSGKALNLMRIGRFEEGQATIRQALRIHPFLAERHMLVPLPDQKL